MIKQRLAAIRHVPLDMDGTIYRGVTLFDTTGPFLSHGAADCVGGLRIYLRGAARGHWRRPNRGVWKTGPRHDPRDSPSSRPATSKPGDGWGSALHGYRHGAAGRGPRCSGSDWRDDGSGSRQI